LLAQDADVRFQQAAQDGVIESPGTVISKIVGVVESPEMATPVSSRSVIR
jgi:hypothetical protein